MKASEEIDRVFLDKKFSATKYMLRYIVGASDDVRKDQLQTIGRYRSLADHEIAGVVEANYSNFNASLGKFNVISNQLQEARAGLVEVSKRSMEGKAILTAKTKNLNDLLLLKYESKKVIEVVDDIDFIDKAPSRIRQMLAAKNAPAAVDIYLRAFDLVLGDKLAVFHAIAIMRNAIIECKQLIEDHDQLGVYITTDATSGAAPAFSASALQPNSSTGLFRFAQLQGNVAIAPPQPATPPVDSNRASVVCPSSLFHVPVVYPDLVEFSDAIVSIGKSTFSYAADMLHPKICDGTLNQLETGVAATELMRSFQESDVYLTAKGKVPHQPLAKVLPTSSTTSSENDKSSTLTAPSGHNYGYSYALPTPILTTPPSSVICPPAMSKKEEMQMKEWDFEVKFKDPAFWAAPHVSKSLLFDQGKLAMLAYINMACDAVSLHTETCMQALLAKHNDADALEHVLGNVKAVSWRCSGLADECLFFLRRELRLQAFYYLTQVASPLMAQASAPPSIASPTAQATGTTAPPPIGPHDCIVAWNAHLMRMKLPLAHDKIAFVWDGLDRLEATIAMHIVQYVPKLSVAGVGQMTVNLCALQQTLTALFYGHPAIPRDFFHFERAKRYNRVYPFHA
ncbi:hypothetical protein DYB32_008308 [Aphanomyces invadans]|uniref:Exocyst complex component Sec8 n=1 Tax=Aphanomyces invadans TaxID=157072 RepID=A0A418ALK8_9STRA|nr:hypothetical protein DYB32_008308 [Aphanomyces invadans]